MAEEYGLMTPEQRKKEIAEAVAAGEAALSSLKAAYELLGSAGSWGIWDMLGGGMISSLVKHSKIDGANREMEAAKRKLANFRRELADVASIQEFHIDVSGFLGFADVFLDNLFVDWAVQSKIRKAETDVYAAMEQVRSVLVRLKTLE